MSDHEAARQALILHLTEVSQLFEERAEGWQLALIATIKDYLRSIDVDLRLIDPLQQLMFDAADQKGVRKPLQEASVETIAAAVVSVLRERGEPRKVDEAVRKVARLAGLNAKELSRFRNNLSSGRRSGNLRPAIIRNYDLALEMLRQLPTPAVQNVALHLKRFVR
jgi:hypothetical protein